MKTPEEIAQQVWADNGTNWIIQSPYYAMVAAIKADRAQRQPDPMNTGFQSWESWLSDMRAVFEALSTGGHKVEVSRNGPEQFAGLRTSRGFGPVVVARSFNIRMSLGGEGLDTETPTPYAGGTHNEGSFT